MKKVSDKHAAESLVHFSMKKGDLIMADAGYGTAQNYIYAQEQGADAILRITPKNFCLYDADGEKIHLIDMLKDAEKQHTEWADLSGCLTYHGSTPSPQIRLEGKWLERLGFTAGSFVSIQCEEGRLVIEKDAAQ